MISAYTNHKASMSDLSERFEFAWNTSKQNVTVFITSSGDLKKVALPDIPTYLKALVGFLSASDEFASVGDNNNWDLVVVAPEELLCSADNVSDDDCCAQREDNVLVIWVQNQALVDSACIEKVSCDKQMFSSR